MSRIPQVCQNRWGNRWKSSFSCLIITSIAWLSVCLLPLIANPNPHPNANAIPNANPFSDPNPNPTLTLNLTLTLTLTPVLCNFRSVICQGPLFAFGAWSPCRFFWSNPRKTLSRTQTRSYRYSSRYVRTQRNEFSRFYYLSLLSYFIYLSEIFQVKESEPVIYICSGFP